jgi:hypothetical protein
MMEGSRSSDYRIEPNNLRIRIRNTGFSKLLHQRVCPYCIPVPKCIATSTGAATLDILILIFIGSPVDNLDGLGRAVLPPLADRGAQSRRPPHGL